MSRTKYRLTPEHEARLPEWRDRWISIALRTAPQTPDERERVREAMRGLYRAADLDPPPREVFCPSPVSAGIAWSIASGVWWLREHPERHAELFGRVVSEAEILAASRLACAVACGRRNAIARVAAATRDATRDATYAATRAATAAATAAATYAATWDATRDAADAATAAATRAAVQLDSLARFIVGCCSCWHRGRNGGNQWAGWCAYLSFFKCVARLALPEYARFRHYQAAAELAGPRFLHARFWIASDFPVTVGRDERHRSHCDDGPAIAWRDGWARYSVHGVVVPRRVVEAPETITIEEIDAEANAEVRRVMMSRFGEARYLRERGGALLHSDGCGDLYRAEREGDDPLTMVRVVDATPDVDGVRRVYWLRVHHELRPLLRGADESGGLLLGEPQELTARNAVASTFGLRGEEYAPEQET